MEFLIVLTLLCAISTFIGAFLFLYPTRAIEVQEKFYEKINWRIEPISMEKEIRNTKIMGFLLLVVTLVIIVYWGACGHVIFFAP